MFGFVTHTANPIGGRFCDTAYGLEATDLRHCIHGCCYCYARGIKEDHPEWEKYSGPYRLFEKELKEYPDGAVVFLQDMGDIGDPTIPTDITDKIFIYIADQSLNTILRPFCFRSIWNVSNFKVHPDAPEGLSLI